MEYHDPPHVTPVTKDPEPVTMALAELWCGVFFFSEGLRATERIIRDMPNTEWIDTPLPEGYCRHGVYVGGCGIDWMCGRCEDGD